VLASLVRLQASLEVYVHPIGVLARWPGCALLSGSRLLR
jgi:hypothetical protein